MENLTLKELRELVSIKEELRELVSIQEKLLDARNAVIAKIPACEVHGDQCLPHAEAWIEEHKGLRLNTIRQSSSILLGEVGRLRKLQKKEYSSNRGAQIIVLQRMAGRLLKLK